MHHTIHKRRRALIADSAAFVFVFVINCRAEFKLGAWPLVILCCHRQNLYDSHFTAFRKKCPLEGPRVSLNLSRFCMSCDST